MQQQERGNVPKFIVTSSVFAPNDMTERLAPTAEDIKERPAVTKLSPANYTEKELFELNSKRRDDSDSWPAYPNTRLALLQHIVKKKIQNVVFLSGDIHCSNVAEIEFDGNDAKGLKAFSVTSSAFYWPFPFADGDPNNYVHNSRPGGKPDQSDPFPVIETDAVMHYRSFGYTQEDNFARLDVDKNAATITVRVFDRNGAAVSVDGPPPDSRQTTQNVLQLAKW
jgi:alkaline phosphatase D